MGTAKWKVKPKGVETVKQGEWWVPANAPDRPSPTPAGRPRSEQRQARTAALNRLPPREWVGSEITWTGKREPRLDPNQYEWMRNPENNRWFARRRNELTGLDPQARADVAGFDSYTTRQGDRIKEAYEEFGRSADAAAQSGNQSLQQLTSSLGAAYNPQDPTGQALAAFTRSGGAANIAPAMADLSRFGSVARDSGLSSFKDFLGQRTGQRREMIGGYRQSAAEAATARDELNASLRGQELQYLGALSGDRTQLQVAGLRETGNAADRATRAATADADRSSRERIAVMRAAASRQERAQAKRGKNAPTAATIRQWAKRAREMWDGVPRTVTESYTDKDGVEKKRQVTQYLNYSYAEIIRELRAMGATDARARLIASKISGGLPVHNGPNMDRSGPAG